MALLAALWASAAPGAAERPEDRWNLADLYPSVNAWADDAARLEAQLKEFAACRGQLGDSARRLKACLDAKADFTKRYARLEVYASELFDEDTGLPDSLELSEKTRILGTKLEEATSFVRPEILRLSKARLERFYAREKSLAIYRHPLERILRAAAHTLDSSGESIVAAFALSKEAAGSTR
ncbi:MAG: oligoendopeptidase F family protein, partial [Betaproteobacteria bacterium]